MATTVFFATNRALLGDGTHPADYAGETGPARISPTLTHGMAFVEGTDPALLRTGRIARISGVSADQYSEAVEADLTGGRNLLVFMHGFANGFSDSITRAAFNRDWLAASGIGAADCTVASFSWPSGGVVVQPGDVLPGLALGPLTLALKLVGVTASPLAEAYLGDQKAARSSAADIVSFLDRLRPAMRQVRRRGGRVFLIAHSMGNLVMESAVNRWADMGLPRTRLFDEAISAAADAAFAESGAGPAWLRSLGRVSGRVSLYHSKADQILWLSELVNGVQRLGEDGPADRRDAAIYPPARCRFADCSNLTDDGPDLTLDSSHQYYRRIAAVRDDMARVMSGRGAGGRVVL